MGTNDLTLKASGGIFNYRVGAIIIDNGEILMVKNSGANHYYTIGGRVHFGESAEEAVLREAFEETQLNFEIDRLAYIHENFFTMETNFFDVDADSNHVHEVAMFFLMKPNALVREKLAASFDEEYGSVSLCWLPINKLGDIQLYPDFFKTELTSPSQGVKYFITKNEKTKIGGGNSL